MKITGQASQYWTNLVNMLAARDPEPINTWRRMKDELKEKYVPPSFSARLMDKWHRYTQGNKSAQEYVEKFDDFLIRCNAINTDGKAQILSRFRAGLRDDFRIEHLARKITELEKAYALVQDLMRPSLTPSLKVTHKQPDLLQVSTLAVSKARLLPIEWILKVRVLRTKAMVLMRSSPN